MEPNSYTASWSWKPGEQQHPYSYSWFNLPNENMQEMAQQEKSLQWTLAYYDMLDVFIDGMTAFPEVEELLKSF